LKKTRPAAQETEGGAGGAILSITKSIGSISLFPPFDKGGQGDFEIDFLRRFLDKRKC
jgi:hypothetical protein